MNDNVRSITYGTLVIFVIGLFVWFGFIYVNACGFTYNCLRGELPVERTPVPTLIPATMSAMQTPVSEVTASEVCRVAATDLIDAWVDAGSPEAEPFQFTDADGRQCEAVSDDVTPLLEALSKQLVEAGTPLP
jgi:hypothetical protein